MQEATNYNGWKNRATWNVALWIENDEGLYNTARDYLKMRKAKGKVGYYAGFIRWAGMQEEKTPDGFKWLGSRLCLSELNDMIRELED